MHRRLLLLSFACLCAAPVLAEVTQLPGAQKVGAGRMTYLSLPVFDATLYAPDGVYSASKPFALKLSYLRTLKGRDIARNSVEQMRRQGHSETKLGVWGKAMAGIFPDVSKGTSLTGVRHADGSTSFYQAGKVIGRVEDPAFGRAFFDIWLGEKTSQPALRRQLLGDAS